MARPLRQLSPEAHLLWSRALAAYESGELTVDDICEVAQVSRRTVFARLREARARREDDAIAGVSRPEIDEGTWLELVWGARRGDGPAYDLATDATDLDERGGVVLIANHAGTRLRRNRLGTGDPVKTDDGEPKSDGRAVNDADRQQGVVYVQQAG